MKTYKVKVISCKSLQTATVEFVHVFSHPIYKKYVKKSKHIACHVEGLKIKEGDLVEIAEIKPISKTKHFKIIKKLK